jgi:hypothetical protein
MNQIASLEGQLRLVGAVLVAIGLTHVVMPRAFGWPAEFAALTPLTRSISYTHTFFVAVMCIMLGLAPLCLTNQMLQAGAMPQAVLAAECTFWGLRWCAQFVAFPSSIWKSSQLYTVGHACFIVLWTWVVAVFVVAFLATW